MKYPIYSIFIISVVSLISLGFVSVATSAPIIERIGASLTHPWGMDFLDESVVLVTERRGKLYKINLADGTRQPITGLPNIEAKRQGGLLDITIAKSDNGLTSIFLCYSKPVVGGSVTAIDRAQLDGSSLQNRRTLFWPIIYQNAIHYGCRLVLNDDYIYASLGERGADMMLKTCHSWRYHQTACDGSIPNDNPRLDGWAPEIFQLASQPPRSSVPSEHWRFVVT